MEPIHRHVFAETPLCFYADTYDREYWGNGSGPPDMLFTIVPADVTCAGCQKAMGMGQYSQYGR